MQFLLAFQIIANEPNAPFYLSHCRCITAICRQIEAELPADMTVYSTSFLLLLFFCTSPPNFSALTELNKKKMHSHATPMVLVLLFFFKICTVFLSQKAAAAPSEGGKRRGRPKKEVRVLGQTVRHQCSRLFKPSLSPN